MNASDVYFKLRAVQIEQAQRSLWRFLRDFAWPVLQPGTPFVDNWHVHVICEHLEAVSSGQIKRLLINLPFRMLKSTIISQAFPAWEWISRPHVQYLTASYAKDVATRDAVDSRKIIESDLYQSAWGSRFLMTTDQNVKTRYENDRKGSRVVTSTDAAGTGFGGNRIIVDDPVSAKEADSLTARAQSIEWWKGTAATRLNNPKEDAIIVVHQRLHHQDLTGYILENEKGWEHLVLPMRYDPALRKTTVLGFQDPRTQDGELMSPNRLDEATVAEMESRLGGYHSQAQLQQNPAPREGSMFKMAWLANRYGTAPDTSQFVRVIQSWDTAKKDKELADYSVCTTWGETTSAYYLLDVYRQKLEFPDLLRAATSQYAKWNPTGVLIEDAASGTSLIQQLRRDTLLPVIPISPRGLSKELRASAVTPVVEAGKVKLPQSAHWLADFEQELSMFPAVPHDDQVDSFTQFLNWAFQPAEIIIG